MSLDPVVDSLEGLHEAIAKEYVKYEGDDASLSGKYVLGLTTAGGLSLENVQGLKNALENEKGVRRRLRSQLDRFVDGEGKPLDPDVVLEAIERSGRSPNGNGDPPEGSISKEQFSEREKAWKRDLKKIEAERDGAAAQLTEYILRNEAVESIAKHEGILRALMPHVLAVADLRDIDGKKRAVVLNEHGEPRISQRSGNTGYMDLDELVGEVLKDDPDFRGCYNGTDASGGGLDRPGSPPPGNHKIDPALPPTERLKLARRAQR